MIVIWMDNERSAAESSRMASHHATTVTCSLISDLFNFDENFKTSLSPAGLDSDSRL